MQKRIVCLANSKKLGASCIAGIDLKSRAWIRPLGSGEQGAITVREQTFADGTRPRPLDIIDVPLDGAVPQPAQPENWRLAAGPWNRVGRLDRNEARALLSDMAVSTPLFGTDERSIPVAGVQVGGVDSSLAVVRPRNLMWKRKIWEDEPKIRALFRHAGARHYLPVTDLAWLTEHAEDDDAELDRLATQGEVFFVVSLGEPYKEEHWKLVASVIAFPAKSSRFLR
jgi:hypothetical protein